MTGTAGSAARGAAIADAMAAGGRPLPEGHRLVSLAEEPALRRPMDELGSGAWPEFMLHDAVVDRLWTRLGDDFPAFQLALLDPGGSIAASGNGAPLAWDGTPTGLPDGWDEQLERTVAGHDAGLAPNTLGAVQIVVGRGHRGAGLSATMVAAFRAMAHLRGFRALIACVRPTGKHRYPLMSIDDYAAWMRWDGLPFDAWLRVHVRLGGRIVRPSPASMTISGTLAEWHGWTGLAMPVSGRYVIEGATNPIDVDVVRDRAVYHDANVWVVHELTRG
jgi:hypothetical protein